MNSRYYDAEIGRFINADDIGYLDPENINGLNLYAYCGDNPVMGVDPNGNAWWKWLVGGIILAGLAAATVLTFGAAAPITGVAATMVVGAMIGAATLATAGAIYGGVTGGWEGASQGFMFGAIGGAVIGAAIGGFIAGAPAIAGYMSKPLFTIGGKLAMAGAGAGAAGITVTVGNAVGALVAGLIILFAKQKFNNPKVTHNQYGDPINKDNIKDYMQYLRKTNQTDLWQQVKLYGKTNMWIKSSIMKGIFIFGIFKEMIRRII